MEKLCVVTEYNEGRGSYRYLRHVVYLKSLSLIGGGLGSHGRFCENVVEHSRSNSCVSLIVNVLYLIVKCVYSLSRHCRNVNYGCIWHICKGCAYPFVETVDCVVVLFYNVPLIDNDYGCLARLMRDTRDLFVLLGNARASVDHYKSDVGAFNRHMSAENSVFFDLIVDLGLTADTCGIYKRKGAVFVFKSCIYRVTGCSRDV